jgi:creatine kinase/arginine kinase
MYDGVKAMIEAEKSLCGPAASAAPVPVKAGPHLKTPADITGMIEFPAGCKSLLCKFLTPDIYSQYCGKKDECGVPFEQMILSGAQNVDSGIGVYAGCHESYYSFKNLFNNFIEEVFETIV